MKTILRLSIVAGCVGSVGLALLYAQGLSQSIKPDSSGGTGTVKLTLSGPVIGGKKEIDCVEFIAGCVKDFRSIKFGMTRKEVESKFRQDGGCQGLSEIRYTHPYCPYFKIDVEFDCKKNPIDQRPIVTEYDRVTKTSKPYIEGLVID